MATGAISPAANFSGSDYGTGSALSFTFGLW
jgi:hypothetical protein